MATSVARRSFFGATAAIVSADEEELDGPSGFAEGVAPEVRRVDVFVDMVTARLAHRDDVECGTPEPGDSGVPNPR